MAKKCAKKYADNRANVDGGPAGRTGPPGRAGREQTGGPGGLAGRADTGTAQLEVTQFNTETGYDYAYIYNGQVPVALAGQAQTAAADGG